MSTILQQHGPWLRPGLAGGIWDNFVSDPNDLDLKKLPLSTKITPDYGVAILKQGKPPGSLSADWRKLACQVEITKIPVLATLQILEFWCLRKAYVLPKRLNKFRKHVSNSNKPVHERPIYLQILSLVGYIYFVLRKRFIRTKSYSSAVRSRRALDKKTAEGNGY